MLNIDICSLIKAFPFPFATFRNLCIDSENRLFIAMNVLDRLPTTENTPKSVTPKVDNKSLLV